MVLQELKGVLELCLRALLVFTVWCWKSHAPVQADDLRGRRRERSLSALGERNHDLILIEIGDLLESFRVVARNVQALLLQERHRRRIEGLSLHSRTSEHEERLVQRISDAFGNLTDGAVLVI